MFYVLLGLVPEALFFALYVIVIKSLKVNRLLLIASSITIYLSLKLIFPYDVKFHFLFIFAFYIIMKLLYNNRVQTTDIFLLTSASLLLMLSSVLTYFIVVLPFNNLILGNVLSKVIAFVILFLFKDKLKNLYKVYYSNWNRKPNMKVKSLTVRNISLVAFNIMIYVISLWITYK